MSGIVGVFQLDGRPVERQALEQMAESIAHRGRDGAGIWLSGSVGFGHRMFHTTPESLRETQPLVDETSGLCLVVDGRVDNRDELKRELQLCGHRLRMDTDAEIILRAYECWGEECAARLLGDFAFAIWDERRRRLFCARDFIGIKPFYYFANERIFLFSSELHSLFKFAETTRRPNEGMIGEYLAVNIQSRDETLFEQIKRLPPAHSLSVGKAGLGCRRYWEIDWATQIRYRRDSEYGEHFLELFRDSVKSRMRSHEAVAADLSGGLDSSSIVSVAESLRQSGEVPDVGFETFSLVFPGKDYDESDYVQAVIEKWAVNSTLVPPSAAELNRFSEHAARFQDFPGYPNGSIVDPIPALAKSKGCRVNLKGVGGDDVFSIHRDHYLNLLRQGKVLNAWHALRMAVERLDVAMFPPPALYWRAALRRFRRYLNRSAETRQFSEPELPMWIAPDFARRTQLADRLNRHSDQSQIADQDQKYLYEIIFDPWVLHSIELEERAATFYGLEQRQPFRDRRIVEFCCAIPAEQRERKYLTRFALRHAMKGLLPEKVRRRRSKGSFNHLFGEAMVKLGGESWFENPQVAAQGMVVSDELRAMYRSTESYLAGNFESPLHIWPLWMVYGVDLWLQNVS